MATLGSVIQMPKGYAGRKPFWDNMYGTPPMQYSLLNDAEPPDNAAIQQFQIQKLEELMKIEIGKQVASHGQAAAELNQLFQSGEINSAVGNYQNEENKKLDEVITKWMQMLNWGYSFGNNNSSSYTQAEYDRVQSYLAQVTAMLENIIKNLNAGQNKILGSYLTQLQQLMHKANFSPADMKSWINHMTHLKGDTVEQIGREWLQQKGIPRLETIVTGAVEYRGSGYEHQGQLIQDLMLIRVNDMNLFDSVSISYRVAGDPKGTVYTVSLREFIDKVNSMSGDEKHIMLTDEGYENLMRYSALNVQAKAGINQLPWNQNKSTSIAINDFTYETGPAMSIASKHVFQLLRTLDDEEPEDVWVKNTSNIYQAMANYGLATALGKVLHLEANLGNQYLLTPSGFISFPERIRQLFKDEKYKAYLKGSIKFGKGVDTLGEAHPVTITNHN